MAARSKSKGRHRVEEKFLVGKWAVKSRSELFVFHDLPLTWR